MKRSMELVVSSSSHINAELSVSPSWYVTKMGLKISNKKFFINFPTKYFDEIKVRCFQTTLECKKKFFLLEGRIELPASAVLRPRHNQLDHPSWVPFMALFKYLITRFCIFVFSVPTIRIWRNKVQKLSIVSLIICLSIRLLWYGEKKVLM